MFTGIIEEVGIVRNIERSPAGVRLTISSHVCASDIKLGDSLAVNGCCLTAVHISGKGRLRQLQFDILNETWQRTNLKFCVPGSSANLERPLAATGRFHGHIVSGHIDGTGKIKSFEKVGADWKLEVEIVSGDMRYLIQKGSIALDGISLTIAALSRKTFTVWIIPHTHKATALHARKAGDQVNIEFDLVGKYVEQMLNLTAK